jgi:para-nitrobenzyl esterase
MQSSFGWNAKDAVASKEDCLYLEIHTPKIGAAAKLPVMVWIHGGANRAGSVGDYVLSNMVMRGIVLVAIQYRLDVFGFLSVSELTQETQTHSSGNYALLDQLAALRWIQHNIDEFGGDPKQVTIFGQSAGAQDVGLLTLSPKSAGLFVRAIEESGTAGFGLPARTLQDNEALGAQLMNLVGVRSVAALRELPAPTLLDASLKLDPPQIEDDSFVWLQAIVDGDVLPDMPERILAEGKQQPVQLIIGSNSSEFPLYGGPANARHAIEIAFGNNSAKALREYKITADDAVSELVSTRIATDVMFRCPSTYVATAHQHAGHPVWQYEFAATPVGGGRPQHSSELPYVFEGRPLPDNASVKLQDYWVRFAQMGDPNLDVLHRWPAFGEAGNYVEFEDSGLQRRRQLGGPVCKLRSSP